LIEPIDIVSEIKRKALELGFSACGFAPAVPLTDFENDFHEWISSGYAGEMTYLTRNADIRLDPRKLVENAKTVISLAAPYYYTLPPAVPGIPRISRYALGDDYHQVLKSMGMELLKWIRTEIASVNGRIFTDSAPIFEREWARRAGLGWIGRNGCLIIPGQGSWFFLAEIVVDIDIQDVNPIVKDRCGNCTRCTDACPTGALSADGSLDPRKCISYLTIEHRSDIPETFRGKWDDWVFGCDLCQDACPWNSKPLQSAIERLRPKPELAEPDTDFLKDLDEGLFNKKFNGTPVMRAGFQGILRNFEFLDREQKITVG